MTERKKTLLTTYELTDSELLDNTILAKALLEIAWIARMTFHNETKTYFNSFIDEKQHHYILISNSNPMDIWQTILYLKGQFPALCWNSEESLYHQISNNSAHSPIELTSNKRLLLYPSYRYGLLKTEGLLEEITKTFPNADFKLISESKADLAMAEKLNIPHEHADAYFDVDGTRKTHTATLV